MPNDLMRRQMALSIHQAGNVDTARQNWLPGQWHSPAAIEARIWMKDEGLTNASGEPTDRLEVWVRALLRTPVPARAGAV